MAITYSMGNTPWVGHADGWRWVMRGMSYTPREWLDGTMSLEADIRGEMEDPTDQDADRRPDRFYKPFPVDFSVPQSGGVVARCLLAARRFGYSVSLQWSGHNAEAELVKFPEYRLPEHPLWHPDLDQLLAACDKDDGTRHVLAERMQDLNLWDEAEFVVKKRDDGRPLFARGGVPVRLMRDFTVEQHARAHQLYLPGLDPAPAGGEEIAFRLIRAAVKYDRAGAV